MVKLNICIVLFCITTINLNAQIFVSSGAVINIQNGAYVDVQGDVNSNENITGLGTLLLNGSITQQINMNGFSLPILQIDNVNNANLISDVVINNGVLFTNGKIVLSNFNASLSDTATTTGMGTSKFFETNGTGFLRRSLQSSISNLTSPVGVGSEYLPIVLSNIGSTYSNATISVQAKAIANTNKNPRTESYLLVYWPVNLSGITGGTTTAVGTYIDPTKVVGVETDLKGFYWDGSKWNLAGSNQNATNNTVTATIGNNTGELYGMNKFVLLDSKIFLQGAYNNSTFLMDDKLRTTAAYNSGAAPTGSLLPTSDPYRAAPYNSYFAHVNNANAETVTNTAFNDKPAAIDNIVDWVFVELRDASTVNNVVLQTRSALLQRDGDVVDIDGVSPLYFKNVDAANYTIVIRHRNHIAMATKPANFVQTLGLVSNATKLNFTNQAMASSFIGTAGTNYFNNGSVNMLYAGNVNGNTNVRYQGSQNDRAVLLSEVSNNELSTASGYLRADLNMNRIVRYQGSQNDRGFLLSNVLGNVELAVKTQLLP